MASYNLELFRVVFKESLDRLGLSLKKATDWINTNLVEEGLEYKYYQLYRFSMTGTAYGRAKLDLEMLRSLARIGFFWNEEDQRPYGEKEIEQLLRVPDPHKPEIDFRELEEVALLRQRIEKLSPTGQIALLGVGVTSSIEISTDHDKLTKSSIGLASRKGKDKVQQIDEFYRLKNWLTESLNRQGLPGQPRTAAQRNGFGGKIGEALNLVIEGDRNVILSEEDYRAASFILLKIKGWGDYSQPIFDPKMERYMGDWAGVRLDLRRPNGQPSTSR